MKRMKLVHCMLIAPLEAAQMSALGTTKSPLHDRLFGDAP